MTGIWMDSILDASPLAAHQTVLRLFAGPMIRRGSQTIDVPDGSQRLLVFLALRRAHVDRRCVAGQLWPVGGDDRAAGNLRSALWRLKKAGIDLVRNDKHALWVDPEVVMDVDVAADWAERLIRGTQTVADTTVTWVRAESIDLLPGWYDDWVLLERERMRQRLLHAMEALSTSLIDLGRVAEGIDVALSVVAAEPLRESGQRVLLAAHIAEGNWAEARRSFLAYKSVLMRELGIEADERIFEDVASRGRGVPVVSGIERGRVSVRR